MAEERHTYTSRKQLWLWSLRKRECRACHFLWFSVAFWEKKQSLHPTIKPEIKHLVHSFWSTYSPEFLDNPERFSKDCAPASCFLSNLWLLVCYSFFCKPHSSNKQVKSNHKMRLLAFDKHKVYFSHGIRVAITDGTRMRERNREEKECINPCLELPKW